jgi:hypothetical protein
MIHCRLTFGTGHEDIEITDGFLAPAVAASDNHATDARIGLKIGA